MEAEADTALGVNIILFLAADSHESMAPLGHIHMYKYSITISMSASHCHYLMLFQGLLLHQQQGRINNDPFSFYWLLGKL